MKYFKIKTFFASILSLILGLAIGFIGNIFLSLPDSYQIPKKVQPHTHISSSHPNAEVINNSDVSIHFLELGNKYTGDCIYIQVNSGDKEYDILVDGGSKTSSIPYITNYVDQYVTDGVLDFVIITHAHEDHYAGYATSKPEDSLFYHYTNNGNSIDRIITFSNTNKTGTQTNMHGNYEENLALAVASGAEHLTVLDCTKERYNSQGTEQGQKVYNLGTDDDGKLISLQFLHTAFYEEINKKPSVSENEYSVCFQLIQGDKRYLFTGDLEEEGEESLIDENRDELKPVEVYKAGHHGSKTSSSAHFMEIIQPKIVVVCCCAGSSEYTSKNENQFPTQKFIDNVSIWTKYIYVTTICLDYKTNSFESMNGTVTVCSNGSQATQVMCSNNNTLLKDTDWFKQNRTLPERAVA